MEWVDLNEFSSVAEKINLIGILTVLEFILAQSGEIFPFAETFTYSESGGGGGGGGTHVYWWYGEMSLWRPPFSDPDFRSLDTTHNRNSAQKIPVTKHLRSHAYQNSWVVARDCSPRSPGLKTPENSSVL